MSAHASNRAERREQVRAREIRRERRMNSFRRTKRAKHNPASQQRKVGRR